MRVALALVAFALLAGCSQHDQDVGGVSPDEDRQLNEAAAALDVNYMAPSPDSGTVANTADQGNAQ